METVRVAGIELGGLLGVYVARRLLLPEPRKEHPTRPALRLRHR